MASPASSTTTTAKVTSKKATTIAKATTTAKATTVTGALPHTFTVSPPSITSIFDPPSSCFNQAYLVTTTSSSKVLRIFPGFQAACYPPGISAGTTFSPGICPSGFEQVAVTVFRPSQTDAVSGASGSVSAATVTTTGTRTGEAQTEATCCPRSVPIPVVPSFTLLTMV
ncbi:hypothetical protein BT63DRAFT_198487 [Microthyrium microscopicum]|uniref:Uncharacterized protein n=1 Tax=Microthyrium microscopicum TaxID=703497 RepID=A0A6A6ULH5_9PEZI|nr:hypothetical protein BT63DRAFT_198487 [Microthyrium microscopicum]